MEGKAVICLLAQRALKVEGRAGPPEDPRHPSSTSSAAAELSNFQEGRRGLVAHRSQRRLAEQAWHFPFSLNTPTPGWALGVQEGIQSVPPDPPASVCEGGSDGQTAEKRGQGSFTLLTQRENQS